MEEAILGGILLDPDALSRIVDYLVTDAFYVVAHRDIYRAVLELHHQGKPNDSRGITVSGIASECRQVKGREGKLGLVVVDYLQMMAEDTGGNRSYELGDVARGLYKLAAEVEVPVLALSQINRAVEARQNKRPTMADLSQSGILEMVADNIILAYRDEYYNSQTAEPNILELILAKARHGDTGTATVFFDKSYGILRNLTQAL